jgi:hypothetical protein
MLHLIKPVARKKRPEIWFVDSLKPASQKEGYTFIYIYKRIVAYVCMVVNLKRFVHGAGHLLAFWMPAPGCSAVLLSPHREPSAPFCGPWPLLAFTGYPGSSGLAANAGQ